MKKNVKSNYLEKMPQRNENIKWSIDEKGIVTLEIENKGVINRIFQKLLKKPKKSYIHLDEMGSFVWTLIDGVKCVEKIGEEFKEKFGDKAHPLYERLAQFFRVLDSYHFIHWTETNKKK